MPFSIIQILILLAMGIPLMAGFIGFHHLKTSAKYRLLAIGYLIFAVNELFFLQLSHPYYFAHIAIDSVLLTILCSMVAMPGLQKKQIPHSPYVVFGVLLAVLSILCIAKPDFNETLANIILILTLLFNLYIVIAHLEDDGIPYIKILSLWFISYFCFRFQNLYINGFFQILFFWYFSYFIAKQVRRSNERHFMENALLRQTRNVVFSMLSDISSSGKNMPSLDYTIIRILETICDTLAIKGAAVYILEQTDSGDKVLRFAQSAGIFWAMHVDEHHVYTRTTFIKEELTQKVFEIGEGAVGTVAQTMEILSLEAANDFQRMKDLGLNPGNIRNLMAVPLKVKNKMLGVLVLQNRQAELSLSAYDIHLLQSLADQAAIPINNVQMYAELAKTELLRQEMDIASGIQRQLLPEKVPAYSTLDAAVFFQPAKEVGGDYYDFIKTGSKVQGIVIGDVSGKGLPAGMTMVVAKTVLQIIAQDKSNVSDIVNSFSREMYIRMQKRQFMTLNFLMWDDMSRTLTYAGAGHEHILLFRSDTGFVEKIKVGGIAVGLAEDPAALTKQGALNLRQGDVFVLYTDGVTEARNKSSEMFTLLRLQNALEKNAHNAHAEKILDNLRMELFNFISGTEQYDDITLMVFAVQ